MRTSSPPLRRFGIKRDTSDRDERAGMVGMTEYARTEFHPAPAGWRAVEFDFETGYWEVFPVVGWLITIDVDEGLHGNAVVVDGDALNADRGFYELLPPGTPLDVDEYRGMARYVAEARRDASQLVSLTAEATARMEPELTEAWNRYCVPS